MTIIKYMFYMMHTDRKGFAKFFSNNSQVKISTMECTVYDMTWEVLSYIYSQQCHWTNFRPMY
jgi:hypothetical protein